MLDDLQNLEKQQGRVRTSKRWNSRTLDLDLILFGDAIISTSRLIVPHPRLTKRNFVLYPLAEIAPNLILPNGTPLQKLLEQCPRDNLQQL